MFRLLHTSDWHLGHTLHGLSRKYEHDQFLRWLVERLEEEKVDALVIAGDIFDTANPSADAHEALYRFLAAARVRLPALDIVVVGGNHDSAARLDAPDPLFRAVGIRVLGGLFGAERRVDSDRLIVPLKASDGSIGAWVAAVPFLRVFDLPSVDAEDPLVEGVRRVYSEVLEAARAKRQPDQALVAVGHCYMTGTHLSELSERKILGGNQHALPVDIFPDDIDYVALGHLHRAQKVGGRESVRYCGSPLPLSLAEAAYKHQVCLADFEDGRLTEVREIVVPRSIPIMRIPKDGYGALEDVLRELAGLPQHSPNMPESDRPYLEVEVSLPNPEPSMRRRIEEVIAGKAARLMRIGVRLEGTGLTLADAYATESLSELQPEDVFRQCYRHSYKGDPPSELLSAFAELVELVHAGAP